MCGSCGSRDLEDLEEYKDFGLLCQKCAKRQVLHLPCSLVLLLLLL